MICGTRWNDRFNNREHVEHMCCVKGAKAAEIHFRDCACGLYEDDYCD